MKQLVGVVAHLLMLAGATYAGPITLTGLFSGANENPSTGSPGTGLATVTVDGTTHMLTVDVVFSGLFPTIPGTNTPSGTTASHIHCCVAPPGNAGVATTTPTFPGFPLGVDAGTYHQTFDLTQASSFNPAFVTAQGSVGAAELALENGLLGGQTYLNIHTNAFPGGEIRAFLATPEPASGALALSACAALWLIRRKRGRTTAGPRV